MSTQVPEDTAQTGALAGIVLAGGESRRMGRDKATLPVPGGTGTLVEHVVGVVSQRCSPVYVMAAPGQPLPALSAAILRDEVRGLGPLPAAGRGLRAAAAAGAQLAFVAAVDMPSLTPDLIDDLMRLAVETGAEVVMPWDGRSHYLAAVYRTDLADRIEELVAAGKRSMRDLIDASDSQQIVLASSGVLTNVNTEDDLLAPARSGR
ncbi:putative molybdenum cofactor guanylyltransferase [Mycobacterium sp. 20KCMC460]|nr:putative molybdenum cofactor guanylyltransferase [Mycobacterium sp. 20KCMC460]